MMTRALKKIISEYNGTIVLITHSNDIKRYLLPHITQMWNYSGDGGDGKLTFGIVRAKDEMRRFIDDCITTEED